MKKLISVLSMKIIEIGGLIGVYLLLSCIGRYIMLSVSPQGNMNVVDRWMCAPFVAIAIIAILIGVGFIIGIVVNANIKLHNRIKGNKVITTPVLVALALLVLGCLFSYWLSFQTPKCNVPILEPVYLYMPSEEGVIIWKKDDDPYLNNLIIEEPIPVYNMVFSYQGKEVGRLSWGTGYLEFEGNVDQSAMIMFDYLQPYIDHYIYTMRQ
jgi:hypothetical protein